MNVDRSVGDPFVARYLPGIDGILRPYLQLDIHAPNGVWNSWGLLDTGADASIFPLTSARTLGYELGELDVLHGTQVSGGVLLWRAREPVFCRIVGDGDPERAVAITPTFVDGADTVLLGRRDFIRAWTIVISERYQTLTLAWAGDS